MHTSAPLIETPRLILRAHTAADLLRLEAMWTDPRVLEYFGGLNPSSQDCWFRLMRYMGHWPLTGFGYWAVCEAGSGDYVADVGLADFRRGLGPGFDGAPEIGWVLSPAAFGKGYATEAAQAALAWHEATFGRVRTVCLIHPDNAASINVARKLGYGPFSDIESGGGPATLFERI
jgi:RimJ/RimL family protein N-acetyltransferase